MNPLIINLAPTGMVPTKSDNPQVPISPVEIEEDCGRCFDAGASILHLHARDSEGAPAWQPEIYREIVTRVRRRCPGAVICVSTSGRNFGKFEQRSAALDLEGEAKPDLASLTLGSLNFPKQASVNDPGMIRALAERMRDRGILPELEVFDLGMIDYARHLIEKGVLKPPFYFNLLLGSLGTLSATPFNLATMVMALPPGSIWAAAGIGRFQFPMNALAIAIGGNVRVGLEDALYMDGSKHRPATNLGLTLRLTALARANERAIATPADVRRLLTLHHVRP